MEILSPKLKGKYAKLAHLGTGKKSSLDWKDSKIKNMDYINASLWHTLTDTDKRAYLNLALGSLTNSVSSKSVGAILVCAWGLTSCKDTNNYLFPVVMPMSLKGTDPNDLEGRAIYSNSTPTDIQVPEASASGWSRALRSGSYICCALIRLIVKEEDNIVNAWKAISDQYLNFYQEELFFSIDPDREALRSIRTIMQNRIIMRGTVGAFLLAGSSFQGQDKGMCRMLYELHLSYTGMHAYDLFLLCADKLKTPLHVLAALLKHPATSEPLEAISEILATYEFPRTADAKKRIQENASMWRYARIFDQDIFAVLQTKNCVMLVSMLAIIASKIESGGSGNVTNIRQISGFVEGQREFLERSAQKAIDICLSREWGDSNMISGIHS